MSGILVSASALLSCSLWLSATTPSSAVFQPLPDLPGGSTSSTLSRISSNGLWAIGQSPSSNGPEAVRWSVSSNTALGIGDLSGGPFSSFGSDISNNGLFASGRGTPATGQVRMMRWMSGFTPAQYNLGTLPFIGFAYSEARAISNDGTKLVGQSSSSSGLRAVLWTATSATSAGGTLTNLGAINLIPTTNGDLTSYFSEANDISGDGMNIVGTSSYLNQQSVIDPDPTDNYTPPPTFRSSGSVGFIRQTTTLIQLSDISGGAMAAGAHAISDDKTRVAGFGTSASGTEGVIWNILPSITVSSVGDLAGGATDCRLLGLNLDGTRAVGKGTDGDGAAAVIWNSSLGLRKLTTVLEERGIDVTGWNLTEANSISADGLVIGGNGINPAGVEQAWVITNADSLFLPVPPLPVITSFTASPEIIAPGGTSTLSWTTTGAVAVRISSGSGTLLLVDPNSSTPVTPAATEIYTLTATDSIGREVTATTSVTINHAPDFAGFSTTTGFETSATLFFANVLMGTTDPEGDSFTITAAGPSSANGGSVLLQTDSILYTPANGHSGADSFPITITDARGSSTVGMVTVTVDDNPATEATTPTIEMLPDRKVRLEFQGIAGRFYEVQRSTNLMQWSVVATLVAGPTGVVIHIDNNPPQKSAFYRLAGVSTLNLPPVFPGFSATTGFQTSLTLSFGNVLLGTTDPENDSFTITAADPVSVNGGNVLLQTDSILYTPPSGFSGEDSFQITITDARGSATDATLLVTVDENPATEATAPALTILSDGKAQLEYEGIAGRTYLIERSTNLAQWTVIDTLVAGPTGLLVFSDNDPPQGSAFYRIRTP